MSNQNKPRILPILFIAILWGLAVLVPATDLRVVFWGLGVGLFFSVYPLSLSCGLTVAGMLALALFLRNDLWALGCNLLCVLPICILWGRFFKSPPAPAPFLLSGLLTETAGTSGALLLTSRRLGYSVWEQFFDNMSSAFSQALDSFVSVESLPAEVDIIEIQGLLTGIVELYRLRVPFFLLVGGAVLSLLFYLVLLGLRRGCGYKKDPLPPFRQFRLPRSTGGLLLLSFLGSILASGTVAVALENLYAFLTLLIVVAGLSYCGFWLAKKGVPAFPRGLLLTFGGLLGTLLSPVWYLLLLLGLTDTLWNLRSFPERKES